MKILWINHRDIKHPKAGGAERTIFEVGKRFVKKGIEINVLSVNNGELKEREVIEGINYMRVRGNFRIHFLLPFYIRKINPDVIIDDLAHGIPWLSPWFTKRQVIVFFRHLHARSLPGQVNFIEEKIIKIMEKMYPFFYKKNIFVTESYTSEADLINLGIKKENIFKIPPGVDLERFYPGIKKENVQLIYFGGLRKYKRPDLSIKVYEDLYKDIKGLKLIVTGQGPMLKSIMEQVKNKNYNIQFTGKVKDEELAKLIRESWVNLHFSVTEGWGYSILESSASGTPTVAFKVPGVVETIKDGYNGFTVEKLEEFKNRILTIIDNEKIYADNSRSFAENFSWDETTEMWMSLINFNKENDRKFLNTVKYNQKKN